MPFESASARHAALIDGGGMIWPPDGEIDAVDRAVMLGFYAIPEEDPDPDPDPGGGVVTGFSEDALAQLSELLAMITVHPYASHAPQRVQGTRLTVFKGEHGFWLPIASYNADRSKLNLTGRSLRLSIADEAGTVLATIDQSAGELEVIGDPINGQWRFKVTPEMSALLAEDKHAHWWSLADYVFGARDEELAWGRLWCLRRAGR